MKPMKNTFLLAIVGAAIATAGVAHADVVDIQFAGTGVYAGAAGSFSGNEGAYTGDGVVAPTWNVLTVANKGTSGSMSNLVASDGTATTEAVSFTASGSYDSGFQQTSPNNNLLDGFLLSAGPSTVTLTGLTANGNYQLYLYGQNGGFNNNGATFSVSIGTGSPITGSNAVTANPSASSGTFQENANYVIFSATANASGTLGVNWITTPGKSEGDFNGLQVISTAVPEPASMGLVGAGALGLLLLGRKRKTA